MSLLDFLVLVLKAQADTLKDLENLFGRDVLVEILERAGDRDDLVREPDSTLWIADPKEVPGEAYKELRKVVGEFRLSPELEFHLWAYPFYRLFIESGIPLLSRHSVPRSLEPLAKEASTAAEAWVRDLGLPAEMATKAIRLTEGRRIRLRTALLNPREKSREESTRS